MQLERDVYFGFLKIFGEEELRTLQAANNYAESLVLRDSKKPRRLEEAKALLRKTMPVARRVLGEGHRLMLKMRSNYGRALCFDSGATLDDLREAVKTFDDTARSARRVLGSHPLTRTIERDLQNARAMLRAHETPS